MYFQKHFINLKQMLLKITRNSWKINCPTVPNQLKSKIIFSKKSPTQDSIRKTLPIQAREPGCFSHKNLSKSTRSYP